MSQNRDDLPYFPYYASNILADKRFRLMSLQECGLWIKIYTECWPNRSVPAAPVELARYLGYPVEEIKAALTERVLSFFEEVNGELISPQLEEYWKKQTKRRAGLSEGGKRGATRRWGKTEDGQSVNPPINDLNMATPLASPLATPLASCMASLNTLKSNTLKSNQVQSLKKEVTSDEWLDGYDSASNQVKVTV
ncbi:hypothetical protein C8R31_106134 [Nitrosospira sp. Nsp2]|uniref:hypothetical protein n=1 Tax=Nitrosospira sp. Nsp2 TaxID=136548 RepID=UPI000D31AD07|nr:hypothetical protein [Nitrosospira sp. Nsp2]PTR14461.1 hypothetical protein C8R31_106134 [Nitrosospira sp. Nsp2]